MSSGGVTISSSIESPPLLQLANDESNYRPSPPEFTCGEEIREDDDGDGNVGSVVFFCTLPGHQRLEFSCRGRSMGVLHDHESSVLLPEEDTAVDPFFFDSGYTLAGRTGFQIWAGARLLLESLVWPLESDSPRLVYWQQRVHATCNIIELGAGVGLVGMSLAGQGGHVLVTDLPTLVTNAILPNQQRNQKDSAASLSCPVWLSGAVPMGRGWLGATPLDWTKSVHEQLSEEQRQDLDLILASDCVWLVSMLDAILDTVSCLFLESPRASFLLSFQKRDVHGESALFTTVESIVDAVHQRKWSLNCLAWNHVKVDGEEEMKKVFLFEIQPEMHCDTTSS